MDELKTLRHYLKAIGRQQWDAVSKETGISALTIRKIAYNSISNPGADKFIALWKYMQSNPVDKVA